MDHEWKIGKPSSACVLCNSAFVSAGPESVVVEGTGPHYFSALIQAPEGLVRTDFCADCFRDRRPADVYYFWKTTVSTGGPAVKKQAPVDIDFVLDFFKRLEGEMAPQRVAFRYILALMLTRKKLLLADGKTRDAQGTEMQLYREKRGGQQHRVYAPELNPDEIIAVTEELGALLGLNKPAAPAAPDAADAVASTEAPVAETVAEESPEAETTRSAS